MGITDGFQCGEACDWEGTQVDWDSTQGDLFKIGINVSFRFDLGWRNTDCSDPQLFVLFYRYRSYGESDFGNWVFLGSGVVGDCSGIPLVKTDGDVGFILVAEDQTSRNIWFCKRGLYEVIADSACTVGGRELMRARPIRVQVV